MSILFQRGDWVLFRSLDTIAQKAGVQLRRLPAVVAKEVVDNALDAGAGKVTVEQVENGFVVQDDGPGLPGTDEEVAELFSIARPLTSSKLLRLPTRGALGNGLRVVVGAILASQGKLVVMTRGRALFLEPQFHTGKTVVIQRTGWSGTGTQVHVTLGPGLQVDLSLARLAIAMAGAGSYKGKTSAHWYSTTAFRELLSAAPPELPLPKLLAHFEGGAKFLKSAETMRSWKIKDLSDVNVASTHRLLKEVAPAPAPRKLGEVGREVGPYPGYGKKADTFNHNGTSLPCVVEAWARRAPEDESASYRDVQVLVNRTPVVSQMKYRQGRNGKKTQGVLSGCGLNHWVGTGTGLYDVCVNVQTPYMPVTNDGKEPDLSPLFTQIAAAVETAVRAARRLSPLARKTSSGKPQSKKDAIAEALDGAVNKASGNGRYRYSLRQLYYAVRPVVGTDLDYGYFGAVVADIETARGADLPGIYRDARGQLYHPHTGETIPLGTMAVEGYERPKLTFNKILYIEKGGFFPLLIENKWPERHDCALVTSQGFASKAAKDVLDLLGDGDEEIEFFCIHDADGPGTGIYQALQEATRSRPGRRVKIINLGLEPAEGRAMGLEVETFERKGKGKVPVADYVNAPDRAWLQENRIELNAMTSPQVLRWLSRKFSDRATIATKVVPDPAVLAAHAAELARDRVRRKLVAELLAEHEARIQADVNERVAALDLAPQVEDINHRLAKSPEKSWRTAVGERVTEELLAPSAKDWERMNDQ